MGRSARGGWAAGLWLMVLASGCGDSFAPPPPPELATVPKAAGLREASAGKAVDMILAAEETFADASWETAARVEAGVLLASFNSHRPKPADGAAGQAALIREAGERRPGCLMVEPMDGPEVVEALNDVRAKGVPVVVLGKEVASRDPDKPLMGVQFASLGGPLKQLAVAIVKDLRFNALPPDAPALIVRNTDWPQDFAPKMMDAVEAALMEAGASKVHRLELAGPQSTTRTAIIRELSIDPKIAVVVGVDQTSTAAAMEMSYQNDLKRPVVVGAAFSIDKQFLPGARANCVGVVDRNESRFGREALRYALGIARGEPAKPVLEVPVPYEARAAVSGLTKPFGSDVPTLPGLK